MEDFSPSLPAVESDAPILFQDNRSLDVYDTISKGDFPKAIATLQSMLLKASDTSQERAILSVLGYCLYKTKQFRKAA